MPTYAYEVIEPDGSDGEVFEVVQHMKDDPLTEHPETGQPVRRVYLPPNLGTKHTEGKSKATLDNRNIERAGFTKYEKDKLTGRYHRTAGKEGPSVIDAPALRKSGMGV